MKQKQIKGKPRSITINQLINASADGDSAADNLLDMLDAGEVQKEDVKRIAEIYNASDLSE